MLEGMSEQRVLINTDWSGYQKVVEAVGEAPAVRLTYDRGRLEIMTISAEHERKKSDLGRLLECLMMAREIDFICGGSQTFQFPKLERGLEPDECYWVKNWPAVRLMRRHDPAVHPPPDLAVEVEVSRALLNRLGIYRAMRVPEIWRWTMEEELVVLVLGQEGDYQPQTRSPIFGDFDPQELARFLRGGEGQATSQMVRAFRASLG